MAREKKIVRGKNSNKGGGCLSDFFFFLFRSNVVEKIMEFTSFRSNIWCLIYYCQNLCYFSINFDCKMSYFFDQLQSNIKI